MPKHSLSMKLHFVRRRAQDGNLHMELGALPSLRPGGPSRVSKTRGDIKFLNSDQGRCLALHEFEKGVLARSTLNTKLAHRRTIRRMLALWNFTPMPITVERVRCLGAALKYGKYRAATQYPSTYKLDAIR